MLNIKEKEVERTEGFEEDRTKDDYWNLILGFYNCILQETQ